MAGFLLVTLFFLASDARAASKSPTRNTFLGIFREGAPKDMSPIYSFERQYGRKPATIMWYTDWSDKFPRIEAENVRKYGAVPHIVWEPWLWGREDGIHLDDILSGKWDKYITEWAAGAKDYGSPVFLRYAHEFNIEKYPWGIGNNAKDPGKYVRAWRHVHGKFKEAGATNVRWIWCFNNYPNPDEEWNDYRKAYPGDAYVDWIGIDGYNWGLTQPWSGWETFSVMIRDQARDAWLAYRKPVMVAEFASADLGGDKPEWIEAIPASLQVSMRPVRAIVWFDIKKEADWRINSTPKSAQAFRKIMRDPHFNGTGKQLAELQIPPRADVIPARKRAVALKATGKITIDGDLADWGEAEWIELNSAALFAEGTIWRGSRDSSGNIAVRWDSEAIYFAAQVEDDKPLKNLKRRNFLWDGDAIEVTLSTNPRAHPSRSKYDPTDFQIGLSPGDGGNNSPAMWVWQLKAAPENGEIEVQKSSDPVGYTLEAKIPWASLGQYRPRAGDALGFDVSLDDGDGGGRKSQLVWAGDFAFYRDPSVWGELELRVE